MKILCIILLITFSCNITYSQDYKPHFIGMKFYTKNYWITVNRVEFKKQIESSFYTQKADGIYLLVYISIINSEKESKILSNSLFTLIDSKGYIYDISEDATNALVLIEPGKIFLLKKLPPRIPKEIIIPFEVPNDNEKYTLRIADSHSYTGIDICPLFFDKPPEEISNFINNFNRAIKEKNASQLSKLFYKEGMSMNAYILRDECGVLIKGYGEALKFAKILIERYWEDKDIYTLMSDKYYKIELAGIDEIDHFYNCFKIKLKSEKIYLYNTYYDDLGRNYNLIKIDSEWKIFEIYDPN